MVRKFFSVEFDVLEWARNEYSIMPGREWLESITYSLFFQTLVLSTVEVGTLVNRFFLWHGEMDISTDRTQGMSIACQSGTST